MSIGGFLERYGEKLFIAMLVHFQYVAVSVAAGFVIALALGILLSRFPGSSRYILPVIGVFQTIPGMVFIGVLFIYLGMVPLTIYTALTIYAMFPMLKNTYSGLIGVNPDIKDAARGCGMTDTQILFKVELPLAMHAIIAGLRMSTVYTVSWAVLAAMIGLGGFGEFVYRGIDANNRVLILGGAVPSAIMAILLGWLIDYLQKKFTPRGLGGER